MPNKRVAALGRTIAKARVAIELYSTTQLRYAQATVDEVIRLGLGERAAVIAIETMMTESSIQMLANGYNAESLNYSHDGVGFDHGSVNQFQQQVGGAPYSTANWGTTGELMQTLNAIGKFLARLQSFDWESMSNWNAAQTVQGSFDPTGGNYKRNDARAQALVTRLWPTPDKDDDDMASFVQASDGDKAVYLVNANGVHKLGNAQEQAVTAAVLGIANKISAFKPTAQIEIYRSVAARPNAL